MFSIISFQRNVSWNCCCFSIWSNVSFVGSYEKSSQKYYIGLCSWYCSPFLYSPYSVGFQVELKWKYIHDICLVVFDALECKFNVSKTKRWMVDGNIVVEENGLPNYKHIQYNVWQTMKQYHQKERRADTFSLHRAIFNANQNWYSVTVHCIVYCVLTGLNHTYNFHISRRYVQPFVKFLQ